MYGQNVFMWINGNKRCFWLIYQRVQFFIEFIKMVKLQNLYGNE